MTVTADAERDRLIQILHKLKAHEESAREIGSLAEAEAFAAKMSELLVKYKIEMSEVDQAVVDEVDPVGEQFVHPEAVGLKSRRKRIAWQEELAITIAVAHFCRVLVAPKTNGLWWVGRASDRQVCVFLFAVIARRLEQHVDREYRRRYQSLYHLNREGELYGWRAGFYKGAIDRLTERFIQKRRVAVRAAVAQATSMWSQQEQRDTALVVLKKADEHVQEYIQVKYPKVVSEIGSKKDTSHSLGRRDGRAFADNLPIDARAFEGEADPTRQLT